MISIDIPGHGALRLDRLISDFNGTLACDGEVIAEIIPLIGALSKELEIHVVTADTFGKAGEQLADLPVKLTVLPADNQDQRKLDYLRQFGARSAVCLGNGRNDMLMLRESALGICLTEREGACVQTLREADIVCRSAVDALDLLLHPKRMIATLRK